MIVSVRTSCSGFRPSGRNALQRTCRRTGAQAGTTWPASTENQIRADERLPLLLDIPARHKAFMIAPILSEVHVEKFLATGQFSQVLCDGENYDGQRPCDFAWVQSLHNQCRDAGVRFDFIGTGNVFRKDGKVYHIPKAYQRVQAQRSGLSYPPGDTGVSMQKRCRTCQRRFRCNGCHWCGKCGNEEGGNS